MQTTYRQYHVSYIRIFDDSGYFCEDSKMFVMKLNDSVFILSVFGRVISLYYQAIYDKTSYSIKRKLWPYNNENCKTVVVSLCETFARIFQWNHIQLIVCPCSEMIILMFFSFVLLNEHLGVFNVLLITLLCCYIGPLDCTQHFHCPQNNQHSNPSSDLIYRVE